MLAIVKKLQASKLFIILLVCSVLVFSYEVNKPKAIAPAALVVPILAGIAIESMASMGIKWATKEIAKKKADDFAAAWAANPANKFDFDGQNPYLNKDGSVYITPSANDRAKIASLLAGALGGAALEDYVSNDGNLTPYVNQGPEGMSHTLTPTSEIGACGIQFFLGATNGGEWIPHSGQYEGKHLVMYYPEEARKNSNWFQQTLLDPGTNFNTNVGGGTSYPGIGQSYSYTTADRAMYSSFLQLCMDLKVPAYASDGLVIPQTINNVYNYNTGIPDGYDIPNKSQLENKPVVIQNIMPPSETEGEITWEQVVTNYGDEETTKQAINDGTGYLLENGDVNNIENVYTISVVNNYYTDVDQEKDKATVEKEIAEYQPPAEVPGDNLPAPIEPVAPINRGMLQVITESYQYLADGVDNSINSMRVVTDSATGLITYLDTSFRWLPAEWRAMFGAAFVLGVFAHFFRR